MTRFVFLLAAAPLFSQNPPGAAPQIEKGELRWFSLGETKAEVARILGPPRLVAEFGNDFESWQYQIGVADEHDYSHQLVFRASSHELISVTLNYEPESNVDALFPEAQTTVHYFPNAEHPQYAVRARRLPGGRVLIAMGVSKPGQSTGQLVLIRETELRFFYPWLTDQLGGH